MNTWPRFLNPALLLWLAFTSPVLADLLRGQVTQVGAREVYVRISPTTVAKVPLEAAQFRVQGETVRPESLLVGQHVVVDDTPLHGFQRYYHTSSDLEGSRTVFIISDADPDDTSSVDWDGDFYLPVEP